MGAKEMLPGASITVVDTLSTSIGLHLMLEAVARAASAGATSQEIVDEIEHIKEKLYILFVVDTLEYLAKGGRIGNAKAFLGTLLNVKPILVLQDGAIEPCEQARSKRKAEARMLDLIVERWGNDGPQVKVAITDSLVPEEARDLGKQLVARLGCPPPLHSELGPVIGTYTGPGCIGIATYA
jgi:DegV family protein with EDD domain